MTLSVGQRLWCVCDDRRYPSGWRTISKIGRKWITMRDGTRVHVNGMRLESGAFGGGRAWLRREDAEASEAAFKAMRELRHRLSRIREWEPATFAAADVIAAGALLGIDLSQEGGDR